MKTRLLIMLAVCLSPFALVPHVDASREVLTVDEMSKRSDAIAIGTVQSTWIDIRLSDKHPIVDTAKIKVDEWIKNDKNSETLEIRYYGYWAKTIDDLRGVFIFDNPLFSYESGQKVLLILDHEESTGVMGGGYYPLFEGSFVIDGDVAISLAGEQLTLQSLYEDIGNNVDKKNESKETDLEFHQWCADRFDSTKHKFLESIKRNVVCDASICPESEPPLFSSALHNDDNFIEKECAKFVDKWAYLTEDNDFTWDSVYWDSFVKHHYYSDPLLDPQRNEKCAELFDLIMLSAPDSNLWYEITETNDFRDAKCASIVEDWKHLAEHDVLDIGISWNNVAENALYGCDQNEVYFSGICMTLETKERAQYIGELENEN